MSRFLLIGLDGAEPSLVQRWMDEGRLPVLARLREMGTFGRLASTNPPATFPAWSSCITGVNPGRHGVFDFTEMVEGRYAVRFVNATGRRAPALWTILSAANKRVGVLGVPATYPPEPVNGFMVSGFDSPVCTGIDASFVYPANLYPQVQDWRFADFQETHIGPGWHDRALKRLLEGIAAKEAIAVDLLKQEPWDFFMTVFGESDTVAHHFWMFHDPSSPRGRVDGVEKHLADAILMVYQRLDGAVGRLMECAGKDVLVGIVSDHGFGGAGLGVVHLNNWLAERGHLRFAVPRDSMLKQLALVVTPERWQGDLFRRFRGMAGRAESRSRFGGIDWQHTRAWSEELNYFPSIRLNVQGREPKGQVEQGEREGYCCALCEELETWPPVRKAWRREELYQGPFVKHAPDIILEFNLEQGYSYSCLRSRGGASSRRLSPEEFTGGKGRGTNGSHRPTGIFFLSRPVPVGAAHIVDIAPTVLAALGVAGPPMDGTPLFGDGCGDGRNHYPLPRQQAYSSEEEQVLEERLRALGYLE